MLIGNFIGYTKSGYSIVRMGQSFFVEDENLTKLEDDELREEFLEFEDTDDDEFDNYLDFEDN